MRVRGAAIAVLIAGVVAATASGAQVAAPARATGTGVQVLLMTIGPGAHIYERFGHNAIWIRDTVASTDLIYNYGTFSFPRTLGETFRFAGQFIMGRPRYWVGVDTSVGWVLEEYRAARRDVDVQELNLTAAEKADLATRLAVNALPANKYYSYDYFRDNCSTRVRDMLDAVLGGALRRATKGRPSEGTLRFHTRRSITNDKLLFTGIDAAFGPHVDQPLDRWDEMFLPDKLQLNIGELSVAGEDGTIVPLVKVTHRLLELHAYHVEPAPPSWTGWFVAAGVGIGGLILLALSHGLAGVVGRVVATVWLMLMGSGGVLLLFFWIFTHQVSTWANHNLLLLTPLAFGLVPMLWSRGEGPSRGRRWLLALTAVSVLAGVLVAVVPIIGYQDMSVTAALTALPTLAAVAVAGRRMAARRGN